MYINPKNKLIALSAHPSIVQYTPYSFEGLTFGDIIDEATVIRVDEGFGMVIKLSDDIQGYAHVSTVIQVVNYCVSQPC